MKYRRCIALLAAALLSASALAESTDTEYLVDMTSDEVVRLEQRLSELGYFAGESDATYDAETRSALESFQQANGLDVTGAADSATLERLNSADALSRQDYLTRFANAYEQMDTLEKGDVSNDVLVMQRRLKEYGYFSGSPGGACRAPTSVLAPPRVAAFASRTSPQSSAGSSAGGGRYVLSKDIRMNAYLRQDMKSRERRRLACFMGRPE